MKNYFHMKPTSSDTWISAKLSVLLLVAALAYTSALIWLARFISFLSDDWGLIRTGPGVFTTPWPGLFYRPLVRLTFYVAGHFSWNPAPIHITNVLLHALACFAVFLVTRQLLRGRQPHVAWMASLLFMVLPIHTDNVYWISGRFDVVCAIFFALTVYCHLRFLSSQIVFYPILTFVFFWCALLSKEMALSLPGALLLVTAFRGKTLKRSAWYVLTPLLLSYALYFMIRWYVTGHLLYSPVNLNVSLIGAVKSLAIAAGSLFRANTIIGGLAIVTVTALLAALSIRDRDLRIDCLLFLSLLLISLVPLLGHVARWYLYVPSMFACPIVARVWLLPTRGRAISRGIAFLFVVLLFYHGVKLLDEGVKWRKTSQISQRTLIHLSESIKEEDCAIYLMNVPSAYSPPGTVGEKPIFAYNLPLALSIISDSQVGEKIAVVNHLWLFKDTSGVSAVSNLNSTTFRLECSDLGFFSFHTPQFVSGRLKPEDQVLKEPWGQVDVLNRRKLLVRFDYPESRIIMYYDGHSWFRM